MTIKGHMKRCKVEVVVVVVVNERNEEMARGEKPLEFGAPKSRLQ